MSAERLEGGAACSDGNACTSDDTCLAGACAPGTPLPGPGPASGLVFTAANALSWPSTVDATSYDVVRGVLSTLTGGGGFAAATEICSAARTAETFVGDGHVPAEGDADWFLIRAVNACGLGTYDDGSQVGSREGGIAGSPNACP